MNVRAVIQEAASVAAVPDMQRIYAASELAAMKIPGAPATPQNIKKMALREGWRFVKLSGKGGGVGYPVTALPQEWQAVILRPAILAARAQNAPAKAGKVSKAVATPTPALPHKGGGSALKDTVVTLTIGDLVIKISRSVSNGAGR